MPFFIWKMSGIDTKWKQNLQNLPNSNTFDQLVKYAVNFVHYYFKILQKRNTSLSRKHVLRQKTVCKKMLQSDLESVEKIWIFLFRLFFMQFLFNIRKISWKRRSIVFTNRRSSEQFAIPKRTLQRFSSKTFQNDSQWVKKLQHLHVLMQLVNTFWTLLYSKGVKQSITTKLVIL